MRNWGRVFALTKSEQRVVILIIFLLVAIAYAKHHYERREMILPASQNSNVVRPEESKPADNGN